VTVVVLTGATRGIGRAAGIELARRTAEVVLVGREPERVGAVVESATPAGGAGRVHGHVADLALMSNVRTLADAIRRRHEGLEQTFALNHLAPFWSPTYCEIALPAAAW
jgi:NAD(P)-dependent dehydrogenase (short-subunit alcohol dehydrogenase family)